MDWTAIRGFNYQPSYGTSGLELWQKFDAGTVEGELARGRLYFPRMNAIRLWLSWDAFTRDPDRFARNFDHALTIAARQGVGVMPVLFNRWHSSELDYGGIYIDHFLPKSSWMQTPGMFDAYLEQIVGAHATDERIIAWDLCNEPFFYGRAASPGPEIVAAEYAWLAGVHDTCKRLGARAPITVGIHPGHGLDGIRQIEPIADVLSIHPYWTADSPPHDKAAYERLLDEYVGFSTEAGKPLVATETCWGAIDDGKRVEIVRYTLGELKKRNIGWLVYLLHHSLIADAHRKEYGPLGAAGNLSFIEADGSLRPGHGVFNEF